MKLIVGLGNPGKKYENTRHNVGFELLEELARKFGAERSREKFQGLVTDIVLDGVAATLLCPHTFMNLSGRSVRAAIDFYKLPIEDLLVVCDDFNLPLGKLRVRARGSAGGQKGLDSIIGQLRDEDFSRLRIGIGPVPERWEAADFVLGKFTAGDREIVNEVLSDASNAVTCWASDGVDVCMNQFN